jgi:hypothetical protein
MIYRPDLARGFEVVVNANFAGEWDPEDAVNADNVYSCITGFVIFMLGVQCSDRASYKQRLLFQLLRQNTFITSFEGDLTYDQLDA